MQNSKCKIIFGEFSEISEFKEFREFRDMYTKFIKLPILIKLFAFLLPGIVFNTQEWERSYFLASDTIFCTHDGAGK